jgi:hypothetical protein
MKATGRVKVKVDGDLLRSKSGASIQLGGVKRTPVPNDQGTVDYKEETVPAEVKCTLVHVGTTDLPAIRAFAGGNVIYETDTGIVYTVPNAFFQEMGELKDGEVEVTFGGDPV